MITRAPTKFERTQIFKAKSSIHSFLIEKDAPPWFRGLSSFQLTAADSLCNALRDDTEQGTSYRVRDCMRCIGLTPVINHKDTMVLIKHSRRDDLAFLWFLMEVHYKSRGHGITYSINEQHILSCIAHLDLRMTLRALDAVLPPAQPTKIELRRRKREQEKLAAAARERLHPRPHKEYVLPYFEKLVEPKEFSGGQLLALWPDYQASIGDYADYANPHLIIPNEKSRWYATQPLEPATRIANHILRDEINKIFSNIEAAALKADTVLTLCEHHKVIDEMEKTLEAELRVIARDRCLKPLDVDKREREANRIRIMEELEKDVSLYMRKFQIMARRSRRSSFVRLLKKDGSCEKCLFDECGDLDDELPPSEECDCWTNCVDIMDSCDCVKHASSKVQTNTNRLSGYSTEHSRPERCGDGIGNLQNVRAFSPASIGDTHSLVGKPNKPFLKKNVVDDQGDHHRHYKAEYSSSQTTPQLFFHAPHDHKPWKFDYRKIFKLRENTQEVQNIKSAFIQAVDSEITLLNKLSEEAHPNICDAVNACAKRTWFEQVHDYNSRTEKAKEELKLTNALGYDQDYYDPNDKKLMYKMLKDGLEYIGKDPKYVLATMPFSYKLTVLREWICQRFGKTYKSSEMGRYFRSTTHIFKDLMANTLANCPFPGEPCKKRFVSYSCYEKLKQRSLRIGRGYNSAMDNSIMSDARAFWFAMRPILHAKGPPRNTYFAYMPSRVGDILRFRLWKPHEFMDAKTHWRRRLRIKRVEATMEDE